MQEELNIYEYEIISLLDQLKENPNNPIIISQLDQIRNNLIDLKKFNKKLFIKMPTCKDGCKDLCILTCFQVKKRYNLINHIIKQCYKKQLGCSLIYQEKN